MFSLELGRIDYSDPWKISRDRRLAMLCTRERRIAYFYELEDTSTFRYRVFNPVQTLASAVGTCTSASWFTLADMTHARQFIERADALVICRTRYDDNINRIVSLARSRRIPVLFDVDDLVFDSSYVHQVVHTIDAPVNGPSDWDFWFGYIGRLGATLRLCDGAITTNCFLAERLADFIPGIDVRIMPNFLNPLQEGISSHVWRTKVERDWRRDHRLHIGYFSGSASHNRDFAIAADAIARVMAEDSRIVLRVVGFMNLPCCLDRYRDRVEVFPLQDYLNLQQLIGDVEINIAPLQQNTFTNCKSELKYFEAAMVGTLTVATPTVAFRAAIKDGHTGLLSNGQSWYANLCKAIELVDNHEGYENVVSCARTECAQQYGSDQFTRVIESAVFRGKDQNVDVHESAMDVLSPVASAC